MGGGQGTSVGTRATVSFPLVLRPEARREFDDGFDWYERRRPGLGVDFAACVQQVLSRIAAAPERHALVLRDIRRATVRRFPYSVFYKVEPTQVVVLAVFHSRRDPKGWQVRV